ncbi:hypothetical protein EJ04DRAFT_478123 [Polyplosphaeria fusca]|uniref:G-protein coupled receptors family 2 profile 2 domain-containing protein n=1 Tax=Polyplosphaeria fusca TaxID=682080 RepID=A0A9P4QN81_9PLEO|nr:hypothetical protein EJ04DRAFT_478123 [Polyplosphaeria fusca]
MPLGKFANMTDLQCAPPLLDVSHFGTTGGYQPGRYCGLAPSSNGTQCCFPCPIQDWLYPPEWKSQLRVSNYLAILSIVLCSFLLLSFAVLPPEKTHRHYLSMGLLFPVLFISLSFVIPVSVNPDMCYDAITPNDMRSSMSCAWTGSLVTLGGLGCVIWVFLRSAWLHIRIVWDRDPGWRFKWGSIVVGALVPVIFLIAVLSSTGFSYRMGQACLPNHEHAIATFWIWLVIFAIAAFVLQAITTGYCIFVYIRTLKKERQNRSLNSLQRAHDTSKLETWRNVKKLFLLQWRNILVSVFVIVGSISFFIVFWTQDSKLGHVFNDPSNTRPVKYWILCQTLSRGLDKAECRKYVSNFTVSLGAVLTSLILASLVGIAVFILLFRATMLYAWRDLFVRTYTITCNHRPATPELTTFENPEKLFSLSPLKRTPIVSAFSADTPSRTSALDIDHDQITPAPPLRPDAHRVDSGAPLIASLPPHLSFFDAGSSLDASRASTPGLTSTPSQLNPVNPYLSYGPPQPQPQPHSQPQPHVPPVPVPTVPQRPLSRASKRLSASSGVERSRIGAPMPGTFVHVNGAMVGYSDWGPLGMNPVTDADFRSE